LDPKEICHIDTEHKGSQGQTAGIISETEAYTQDDPACHSYNGRRTSRSEVMFGPPGRIYIYFIYGMYYCLNIVTEAENRACAVLIRSLIPLSGISIFKANRARISDKKNWANGPGKLVLAMGIPPSLNGRCIVEPPTPLHIENRGIVCDEIQQTPRIGIRKGQDKLWRFIAKITPLKSNGQDDDR